MATTRAPEWITTEPDYFSTSYFWPVRNGWQVASRKRFTAVYGGGDGAGDGHNSVGRIAVFRDNYMCATQGGYYVDVPDVGPIKFVSAPLGSRHNLNRVQRKARLAFITDRGVRGVFDLSDRSVTLEEAP
jgi:hypothetical protein